MNTGLIPRGQLERIAAAVRELVNTYGHPDEIPIGALAGQGIAPDVAEKCEALLTSEDFPRAVAAATAKWLRLIEEFSESEDSGAARLEAHGWVLVCGNGQRCARCGRPVIGEAALHPQSHRHLHVACALVVSGLRNVQVAS